MNLVVNLCESFNLLICKSSINTMNLGVTLGEYLKSIGNDYIFLFLNFKF